MEQMAITALDGGGTLTAVEGAEAARRAAEVSVMHLAAHWADLHGDHEGVTRAHGKTDEPGEEREHPQFRRFGGVGTPLVHEFATAELGVSLRKHPAGARALLADALDLRHRLAPLWELTFTDAPVEVWVLRKIASRTRHLSEQDAELVARSLVSQVVSLPPGRLLEKLDSLVVLADARADEGERDKQKDRRFVQFNSSDQRGLKGLYAKLAAPDAIVGDAQVQRLAEVLRVRDKTAGTPRAELDSIQVARARALGMMLADPEAALELIRGEAPDQESGQAPDQESGQAPEPGTEHASPATSAGGETATLATRIPLTLHLHLSEGALQMLARAKVRGDGHRVAGVGRLEREGVVNLHEALELLGLSNVTIRPVLDPAATAPADSYAFTGNLREAVLVRTPADVYPFATCTTHHMDLDHTVPHPGGVDPGGVDPGGVDPGGTDPPDKDAGATCLGNAGPMVRHHHRIKTRGPMAVRQPVPGVYVWQTRHERYLMTDSSGTHDLDPDVGRGFFGHDPVQLGRSVTLLHHRLGLLGHDAA